MESSNCFKFPPFFGALNQYLDKKLVWPKQSWTFWSLSNVQHLWALPQSHSPFSPTSFFEHFFARNVLKQTQTEQVFKSSRVDVGHRGNLVDLCECIVGCVVCKKTHTTSSLWIIWSDEIEPSVNLTCQVNHCLTARLFYFVRTP